MALMITWNMQGAQGNYGSKWQDIDSRINNPNKESPSVLLLQECGIPPRMYTPPSWGAFAGAPAGLTRGSINFSTARNPKCYFILHQAWAANNSKSLAVLIQTAPNIDPNDGQKRISNNLSLNVRFINPPPPMVGNTRPVIGVNTAGATFYSMHAPSGTKVGCSRTYIDNVINQALGNGPYVIGGDFNSEPQDLYTPPGVVAPFPYPIPNGTLNISGQNTYWPPRAGQIPKQYDYFTSSNNVPGTILNNVAITNLLSDHSGVMAQF